jgi:ribosomal protein L35AE/L33A
MIANLALFLEKQNLFHGRFTVQHGTRDGVKDRHETGLPDAFRGAPLA